MLQVLDTGPNSPEMNMRADEKLLSELDPKADPILHFYDWMGPCATYGYFLDPRKHLVLDRVYKNKVSLARRPTGGGIVFHIWDLAFSFLLPSSHPRFSSNTLENYRFVNARVLEAVQDLLPSPEKVELISHDFDSKDPACRNFCMARPTVYDVVYQGRKIAGAAQRRRKNGYLHQGTISLALPQVGLLSDLLLSKEDVIQAMMAYTFAPLGRCYSGRKLRELRGSLQKRLEEKLRSQL